MEEFIKVMKALSDANRVKLLKMLQHRKMCVCEIQAALEIAQPRFPSISRSWRRLGWWRGRRTAYG